MTLVLRVNLCSLLAGAMTLLAVALTGCEAASIELGALTRTGIELATVFRATWALVLARLAGVDRARVDGVTIDVPREGDVAAWLRAHVVTNGAAKSVINDGGVTWTIAGTTARKAIDIARVE